MSDSSNSTRANGNDLNHSDAYDAERRSEETNQRSVHDNINHAAVAADGSSEPTNGSRTLGGHGNTSASSNNPSSTQTFRQYGLLGFHIGELQHLSQQEPIFMNTNAPNSTFICGSQGSGKSYTLACMLENCLLSESATSHLSHPVGGIVFHYDLDSSMAGAEAARLCSRGIKVRVLVSTSNRRVLEEAYMKLEGAKENLEVQPLLLQSKHLSVESMLKLMSFSEQDGRVPLYQIVIQRILRGMANEANERGGAAFNFEDFKRRLNEAELSKDQRKPLDLRLDLLESFMDRSKGARFGKGIFAVEAGTLTIVDFSDPFVDSSTVCLLFDICVSLFKKNRPKSGLVIAVDEAHKFMGLSTAATIFTERLLTTIREQRHNATRVIIATQEPTISERLMELCSVTVVHRFTSPTWFTAIKGHLGGASALLSTLEDQSSLFESIMELQVGQSLVFSPGSFMSSDDHGQPKKLGSGIVKMQTRMRFGVDGGKSELASGGRE